MEVCLGRRAAGAANSATAPLTSSPDLVSATKPSEERGTAHQGYDSDNNILRSESCPSSLIRSPSAALTIALKPSAPRKQKCPSPSHVRAMCLDDVAEITISLTTLEDAKATAQERPPARDGVHEEAHDQKCWIKPCQSYSRSSGFGRVYH